MADILLTTYSGNQFWGNTFSGHKVRLQVYQRLDPQNNRSIFIWKVWCENAASTTSRLSIDGTQAHGYPDRVGVTSYTSTNPYTGQVIKTHDASGVFKSEINITWSNVVSGYGQDTWNKTVSITSTIDRNPVASVTLSVGTATSSSIPITVVASDTCDGWDYSLDGGSTWTSFSTTVGKSVSTTITGLTPNTQYSMVARARRQYNHVYRNSNLVGVNTLGATTIESVNQLTIDNTSQDIVFFATVYDYSFSHTLAIQNGNDTVLTITIPNLTLYTGTNTIQLTTAQRNTILAYMANIKQFTATYALYTYNGSSIVGSASTKTAVIQTSPENSSPLFSSFTYADTNSVSTAVTNNNQILIESASTLSVSVTSATPRNYATISSYSVTADTKNVSSVNSTISVGTIDNYGIIPVQVTVIDSRGYTATLSTNVEVIAYEKISIANYIVRRVNDTEDGIDADITGLFSPVVIDDVDKNSLQHFYYRYRMTSSESWSEYEDLLSSLVIDDGFFSFSNSSWIELDSDYSFYIEFYVEDALTSDSVIVTISQGSPLMMLKRKRVGINNRDPQVALDVIGDIFLNGSSIAASSSENILDNADWGYTLINQRANEEYSLDNEYGIDRWILDGHISITPPSATSHGSIVMDRLSTMKQRIERLPIEMMGAQLCFGIDIDGEINSQPVQFPDDIGQTSTVPITSGVSIEAGYDSVDDPESSGWVINEISNVEACPYIKIIATSALNVRRVWLGFGKKCYMDTTPPKSYAENLGICQRYLVIYRPNGVNGNKIGGGTGSYIVGIGKCMHRDAVYIPLHVSPALRVVPIVSFSGNLFLAFNKTNGSTAGARIESFNALAGRYDIVITCGGHLNNIQLIINGIDAGYSPPRVYEIFYSYVGYSAYIGGTPSDNPADPKPYLMLNAEL